MVNSAGQTAILERPYTDRYFTLMEHAADGIAVVQDGLFKLVNRAMIRMSGYEKEELLGMPFIRLLAPASQSLVMAMYRDRMAGKDIPSIYEAKAVTKSGGVRDIEINAALIEYEGRAADEVIVRDITERKRVENDLKERLKELHCLYSIGLIAEKPGITLRELCQEVANVLPQAWQYPEIACALITTIDGEEFKTAKYRETDWKQSADIEAYGTKAGMVEVGYLEERPVSDEGPFLKEERVLLDAVAERLGIYIERKQAEVELKAEKKKLEAVMENVIDGIAVSDVQGKVIQANKAFVEMHGYDSPDEVIGRTFFDFIAEEELPRVAERFQEMMAKKEMTIKNLEMTNLNKDGSKFAGMINVANSWDKDGSLTRSFVVVRDITERKWAEEKEKQLQQELDIASRLASIGEMASGIAHEINNPLTSVIGFSQLLMYKDLPNDVKKDLEVIDHEAKRVAKIVEGLLTFARQRKQGSEYVDINEVISQTLELRSYPMKVNNIEATTCLAPNLPYTMADANQLQQVFLNIILNAEKEMTNTHGKGKLLVKTEKVGDSIRVSFKDNGPGIIKEDLGKVFDPFFTTREVGEGTGLGLSICHGIIVSHNGRIYAKSTLGKGATFIIELPIVADTKQAEDTEVVEEETWHGRGSKILVVDDEPAILDFLNCLLTDQGYKVETAGRAENVLKKIESGKYDLILVDIKLPGMNGIELYRRIEEVAPDLANKVMFITGDVMQTTTKAFLDRTGAAYISKPIDIERLKKESNHILTKGLEQQRT